MTPNFKQKRLVDHAYRKSAQHRHCMVRHPETGDYCSGEGVVLAHIRMAGNAGTGIKPDDRDSLFLCRQHHDEFDYRLGYVGAKKGGLEWLVRNVFLPERWAAYRKYLSEVGR